MPAYSHKLCQCCSLVLVPTGQQAAAGASWATYHLLRTPVEQAEPALPHKATLLQVLCKHMPQSAEGHACLLLLN